jgi:hypothetical protein
VTLRLLAAIAFIIAIILFVIGGVATAVNLKDIAFGLVATAAGLAFFALEGVNFPTRQP